MRIHAGLFASYVLASVVSRKNAAQNPYERAYRVFAVYVRTLAKVAGSLVPHSIGQQMNIRQKAIVTHPFMNGTVTSGWCRKQLPVAYDTIRRDLLELVKRGVLEQKGKRRSTRYITRNETS